MSEWLPFVFFISEARYICARSYPYRSHRYKYNRISLTYDFETLTFSLIVKPQTVCLYPLPSALVLEG